MTTPALSSFVRVGLADEFELDTFRIFEIEGRPVGVVRTEKGFFAVRNRCPHQGAEICAGRLTGTMVPSPPQQYRYSEEKPILMCPWHRWEFDLETGESVEHVAKHRLVTYDVDVADGDVYVSSRPRRSSNG